MALDTEAESEKAEQAHERYRGVGLALMTTVIGLSTGALYELGKEASLRGMARLFFVPICACLVQQLAHYLGSQHQAKSLRHWSRWLGKHERKDPADDQMKELDARFAEMGKAECWYTAADYACSAAVLLFIGIGAFVCATKF
ncbi:MAG: hypothetical protein SF051_05775 [Elusimicrobiota bacterium]|nr:hypothetical protein [Elusimicrobiota bacterium]